MADNRDDTLERRSIDPWNSSQYAPTPGYFGYSPVYSSLSPHHALQQVSGRLGFLPLAEWEEGCEYEQQPPQYVCYTIEWKLTLNHKKVGGETEKDLVVAPSEYWEDILRAALENMVQTKRKRNQRIRSESTAITVSVNDRTQSPLEKFYTSTDINWTPVEKQLRKWSNLLRVGKRLKVGISFNYMQDDNGDGPISTSRNRKSDKRNRVTATNTMLAEREECLIAEEERTGRPASWNHVYELMQCNVASCQLNSDWCWEDPTDQRHYKLRQPHIERLIDYVDDGGKLESHGDVPRDIRRDLILESQAGRKSKRTNLSATGAPYPPVNINVLPAQTSRKTVTTATPPTFSCVAEYPIIPGPREAAVREYCRWLESQATEEEYKADFRRICQVTLANHLDLELILEEPDPNFFIEQGIKIGTVRRFIRDIHEWATHVKANPLHREVAGEGLDDVNE